MPCGSRCPHISQMMSSDVIIDTATCLPSRPSSRPRHVIISYRIPDDTATQSITCDTGYDDICFRLVHLPAPSHRPTCFPPRFPPNRVAQRVGSRARRHPVRYSPRLPALSACHHLTHRPISSAHPFRPLLACLVPSYRRRPLPSVPCCSSISSAHLPSRPASRSASRQASRLVSSRLTVCHASRFVLLRLIGSSVQPIAYHTPPNVAHSSHHLTCLAPSHRIPHRIRRATS